jgi:hypothetical protein
MKAKTVDENTKRYCMIREVKSSPTDQSSPEDDQSRTKAIANRSTNSKLSITFHMAASVDSLDYEKGLIEPFTKSWTLKIAS